MVGGGELTPSCSPRLRVAVDINPRTTNSLKLKKQVRLSEVWVASCLDEVTVKKICADTSFVIGWPTTNSVVTFCSPEIKERWFSALHRNIQEQKQNDFPKNMTLKILLMEVDELASTTIITVTNTETTEKVIGRAVYQLGLSGQTSDFLLWVNSSKEALSYPLIGHESLYSIAQTNLRHTPQHTTLRTTEDCPDPTSLNKVPEKKQYKFILKHKSELPSVLERELSEKKSLKKRKSLLYWALQKNASLTLESSMVQSPEEEPDHKLFGLDLSTLCRSGCLPKPIMDMLMLLYKEGPTTPGIFRRSANAKTCKEIKEKLNSGAPVSMAGESVFVSASVLTEFLRNIPDSVLSSGMHSQWMTAMQGRTKQQKVHSLQRLVAQLPEGNRLLLKYLFGVLDHIVANSEENQMTAFNLALCVAPNMLWLPNPKRPEDESRNMGKVTQLVQFLIENTPEIFGEDIPVLLLRAQAESASGAEDKPVLKTIKGFYEFQFQKDGDKEAEAQKEVEEEALSVLEETQTKPAQGKIKNQAQSTEAQTELAQEKAKGRIQPVKAQVEPVDAKAMLAQVQAKLAKAKVQPAKAKAKAKSKMTVALAEPLEVQAKSPKARVKLALALPELPEVPTKSPKAKVKLGLALTEPVKAQARPPKIKTKIALTLAEPAETQPESTKVQAEHTGVRSELLEVQAEAQGEADEEQAKEPDEQAWKAKEQEEEQTEAHVESAKKQAEPAGAQAKPAQEPAKEQVITQDEPAEKHPEPAKQHTKPTEKQSQTANEQAEVQAVQSGMQNELTEVCSVPSQVQAEAQVKLPEVQKEVQDEPAKEQIEAQATPGQEQVEVQAEAAKEQVDACKEQAKPAKDPAKPCREEAEPEEVQAEVQVKMSEVPKKKQAEAAKIQGEADMVQTELGQAQAKSTKEQAKELEAQVKPADVQHKLGEPSKVQAVPASTALSPSECMVRPKESSQARKHKHLHCSHPPGQGKNEHLVIRDESEAPNSLLQEEVDETGQGALAGTCSESRARESPSRCLRSGFALFRSATQWWPSKRSKITADHKDL
nr:rho GTPase-activating protein 20-like [Oryctolagus cuniculus]